MKTVSYYAKSKLIHKLKSKTGENKVSSGAALVPKAKVKKATYFKNAFQRHCCYKPGYREHKK